MGISAETIEGYYREAFLTFDKNRQPPEINVTFYPYVGINHTIRIRNGGVFVRIAEICRDLPASAQRALALILVAKLYRRRVPVVARDVYSAAVSTEEYRVRATANKRKHGRKVLSSPQGQAYDLEAIFEVLNASYFGGSVPKPTLTWSARKTYRILGHHDATHKTIVISRSLDSASVPKFIVEYIVFHEMLHIHHPAKIVNGRRYHHTPIFRRDERKFKYYEEAELWIERNVRKLKRDAKRK
ncbi:MAG TPA: SprT-like domain-containing protein [Pyrinomonadaceae bacterium]|nr:SprT-like domain-containing protein [Pyrinomonadaceae bacterium]